VHFGFDDDQIAFRDAVRDLLDKECPPDVVRAAWSAPAGSLDRGVWDRLDEMGVITTLVPSDDGGLGLDERSLVLVLEETGRAGLPHPFVETAAVAAPLVGVDHGRVGLVATDLGGPHVPCAADADRLLLRDRASGALHLVEVADVTLTTRRPSNGPSTAGPGALRPSSSASASGCSTPPSPTSSSATSSGCPSGRSRR
jgi:alkylation response protein AidB-like acyl-CoA dehydrogenase